MLLRESLLDKNEIIIDEKRRLAVNMRNLTSFQNKIYHRNYFKTFRPDLNSLDAFVFQQKWKLGEQFLNELSRSFNVELTRMHLHTPMSDINKKMRFYAEELNNLSDPYIIGCKLAVDRNWEDANKLVSYMDRILRRIQKYGLQYPGLVNFYDKNQLETKENELTEHFYREMRKPPSQ